jgi:GNAT superfamily N-acetyltransferase
MKVRDGDESELAELTRLWYDSWQDSHAHLQPSELIRHRTLDSFRERLRVALPAVRVVGPVGAPLGFCLVRGDELDQLFVSAAARGTGVAAALVADAEARLAGAGVERAWLACAIGNERAAKFYEKHGWHRAGTMVNRAETSERTFALDTWRYEKALSPLARSRTPEPVPPPPGARAPSPRAPFE